MTEQARLKLQEIKNPRCKQAGYFNESVTLLSRAQLNRSSRALRAPSGAASCGVSTHNRMKAALQRTQESAERAYQLAVVIALNKAKAKARAEQVRAEQVRAEITRVRMT